MIDNTNCCGCGACKDACPKSAITMQEDQDGFLIPLIDTQLCVNCGICNATCPRINTPPISSNSYECFAAYHKSTEVRQSSSSGGMFTALSDYIIQNNGVVVGVAQKPDLTAEMRLVRTKEERDQLKKSKYVQSRTNKVYTAVKNLLDDGQQIMFTGTPCQVAALKLFLKKDYENLFCVDILCHGIPSESIFLDYIRYLEKRKKHRIAKYNFRDRHPSMGWKKTVFSAEYEDGRIERIDGRFDYYYGLFYRNIALREACFDCKHKTKERVGDITLGDFWGIEKLLPNVDTYDGVSLVLVNSEKGKKLFAAIKESITAYPCDISGIIPQTMRGNDTPYRYRKSFFKMRRKHGFSCACFFHVFLFRVAMKLHLVKKNYS